MGSQTFEILRQGIWASLSGGWFLDPRQSIFSNTFHLYLFLFLLCTPFTLYLYFKPSLYMWTAYCTCITSLFLSVKFVNYRLHQMFDTSECIVEEPSGGQDDGDVTSGKQRVCELEAIEMHELKRDCEPCIEEPSQGKGLQKKDLEEVDGALSNRKDIAETMKEENRRVQGASSEGGKTSRQTIDLKVDVHHFEKETTPAAEPAEVEEVVDISYKSKTVQHEGMGTSASAISNNVPDAESKERHSQDSMDDSSAGAPKPLPAGAARRYANLSNLARSFPSNEYSSMGMQESFQLGYYMENGSGDKKRWESGGAVRRTQSALETCQPANTQSTKQSVPPSHPVSLDWLSLVAASPHSPSQDIVIPNTSGDISPIVEGSEECALAPAVDIHAGRTLQLSDYKGAEEHFHTPKGSQSPLLSGKSWAARKVPPPKPPRRQSTGISDTTSRLTSFYSNRNLVGRASSDTPLRRSDSEGTLWKIGAYQQNNACLQDSSSRVFSSSSHTCTSHSESTQTEIISEPTSPQKILAAFTKSPVGEAITHLHGNSILTKASRGDVEAEMACFSLPMDVATSVRNSLASDASSSMGLSLLFPEGEDPLLKHTEDSSESSSPSETSEMSQLLPEAVPHSAITGIRQGARPKLLTFSPSSSVSSRQECPKHPSLHSSYILPPPPPIPGPTSRFHAGQEDGESMRNRRAEYERLEMLSLPSQGQRTGRRERNLPRRTQSDDRDRSYEGSRQRTRGSRSHSIKEPIELPSSSSRSTIREESEDSGFGEKREGAMDGIDHSQNDTTIRGVTVRRMGARRRRQRNTRRPSRADSSESEQVQQPFFGNAALSAIAPLLTLPGRHLARSHDDTSEGAVHCFQDEFGNWMAYTFNEGESGIAIPSDTSLVFLPRHSSMRSELGSNSSLSSIRVPPDPSSVLFQPPRRQSNRTVARHQLPSTMNNDSSNLWSGGQGSEETATASRSTMSSLFSRVPFHMLHTPFLDRTRQTAPSDPITAGELRLLRHTWSHQNYTSSPLAAVRLTFSSSSFPLPEELPPKPNQYYKFHLVPKKSIKVHFDRLALLACLDRNLTVLENMASVFLASTVAILGSILLDLGYFQDLSIFFFCFVMAGCQYSLLKSVQPDAASPTHGYNRIVLFSRSVYFCICAFVILLLHYEIQSKEKQDTQPSPLTLYGFQLSSVNVLRAAQNVMLVFIQLFPVIFSVGLLPQVNTFATYLLEQIDIHAFGGTAVTGLVSGIYCLFRSILAVFILFGFAYAGLREALSSQHFIFSIYSGLVVSLSYFLSRCSSDPTVVVRIIKRWISTEFGHGQESHPITDDHMDPLPQKLEATVLSRMKSDAIISILGAVLVFAIHCSTVFTAAQPGFNDVLWIVAAITGFIIHYLFSQLRKQMPWLCFSEPILKSFEHDSWEVRRSARVMWFEKLFVYLSVFEKYVLLPLVIVGALTTDAPMIVNKFGLYGGSVVVVIASLKLLRTCFCDDSRIYMVLVLTALAFRVDFPGWSETFLLDFYFMTIIFQKLYEFYLKMKFVITYIAPWQITWGSAFHAFAQPFSVPHSAMLFVQGLASSIVSAPLQPFLGSAIFWTSHVRPIKFWERDYNTKRVDHSNTRLASHVQRNLGEDDNNLNSIFYEHLTRSMQHSLCGDLMLGRWGIVSQGDVFVLTSPSDNLNCLVHIIEYGNGLVTFQVRGLEFRGTYCQQREVEAIVEGVEEDDGCCCCEPGHLAGVLSVNAAFGQRWLAWEVTHTRFVLEGYSIADNSAASMLQAFDLRSVLVTYYVKSIIFYAMTAEKLEAWLSNTFIKEALELMNEKSFVDLDPVFHVSIDQDYDLRCGGVTRSAFCNIYYSWIEHCAKQLDTPLPCSKDSFVVTLCFALSLLGRRTLVQNNAAAGVDLFLHGLHNLFKGVFDTASARDEWIYTDMELVKKVIIPAARMSLKLHQDHFTCHDEYDDHELLFVAIKNIAEEYVISHEADPSWRAAVLQSKPHLLALRHVQDDGTDEYKIIMLNRRHLGFRVIKVNRECVRGLWAGQQQELVYLRNRNPERGSIQNAKQALRNMINSSCDQPIGYPIYVSPLTTSYAETNEQLCSVVGSYISVSACKAVIIQAWRRLRRRCGESCSSGGTMPQDNPGFGQEGTYSSRPPQHRPPPPPMYCIQSIPMTTFSVNDGSSVLRSSGSASLPVDLTSSRIPMASGGRRNSGLQPSIPLSSSLSTSISHRNKSLVGLTGFIAEATPKDTQPYMMFLNRNTSIMTGTSGTIAITEGKDTLLPLHIPSHVRIIDANQVYDAINLNRRIDVVWPDETMRQRGGRSQWRDWVPVEGMEGPVVHFWVPRHREPAHRSHVDRTILLVQIGDRFVPIAESGVQEISAGVEHQED